MSVNKRYFWLKLKDDFFKDKAIKKLRLMAGGDTYTIIYLKMLLLSLENKGKLFFDEVEKDFVAEIALEIDENYDDVAMTIAYLISKKMLIADENNDEYFLSEIPYMIGSETASTRRARLSREKKKEQKALQCNNNATKRNGDIDIDIDIDIEKDIVQIPSSDDEVAQSNKKTANQELLEVQERIWSEYPNKRGKRSAMNAIKSLYKTHTDVLIIKAIQMYKEDVETQRKAGFKDLRYVNGDTFFRSRIHDYLGKDGVNGVNQLGEENSESKRKESQYGYLYRNK